MSELSAAEFRTIEEAFGSSSGYVMDFSNATFQSFFTRTLGVDIYQEQWAKLGNSKGKRLRCFLDQASTAQILQVLKELKAYKEAANWKADWHSLDDEERIKSALSKILERLSNGQKLGAELQNPTEWLAQVSQKLREITRVASNAFIDSHENEDREVPNGTKELLATHYKALKEIIPDDFPQSAFGDMGRHIRFSESIDMRNIAFDDAPDIMEKAESYAIAATQSHENEFDVRNLVDEIFRRKLLNTINSDDQDYHALVLTCSVILSDRLRNMAGGEDVGKIFSPKDPILMVPPDLESSTNRNYQQGAMWLFQGFQAFFRNTHAHGVTDTDRDMALQALMLFSLLANILASARPVDEV